MTAFDKKVNQIAAYRERERQKAALVDALYCHDCDGIDD